MNQYTKAIAPISHKQVVLDEITKRPLQTMQQIAQATGYGYSTVRSCLRIMRNEGRAKQSQTRSAKSAATWAAGRDDAFLDRDCNAPSIKPPSDFVAFRDPLHTAFFGNPKPQPEGKE